VSESGCQLPPSSFLPFAFSCIWVSETGWQLPPGRNLAFRCRQLCEVGIVPTIFGNSVVRSRHAHRPGRTAVRGCRLIDTRKPGRPTCGLRTTCQSMRRHRAQNADDRGGVTCLCDTQLLGACLHSSALAALALGPSGACQRYQSSIHPHGPRRRAPGGVGPISAAWGGLSAWSAQPRFAYRGCGRVY